MKERQELWCHECQKYVQFDIDVELDGDHIIVCPNCKHEHCRVVKDGKVTEVRWDSRNGGGWTGNAYMTSGATSTNASTYNTYSGTVMASVSTQFTYGAWMNLSTGTA